MDKKRNLTPLYLLINILILALIILLNPELKNIDDILSLIDYKWVILSIGFMFIFWFFDTVIISYIMDLTLNKKIGFFNTFTINMIGRYYLSLIPLGGGQTAQIVYLTKWNISPGTSSSMLMIKYWVHQMALAIYAIFAFLLKGSAIKIHRSYMFWAAIFGFAVNIMGPFLLYLLSSKEGLLHKIVIGIINFLKNKGIVKKEEKFSRKIIDFIDDYSRAVKFTNDNIKGLKWPLILSFFQVAVFYSIPYLIYKGCSLSKAGIIDMMLTNIFLHFAVCFVPTPGAAGASEGGFFSLFSLYFPEDLILVAMIFWRFISFYLTVIIGGAMVFIEKFREKNRKKV